MSSSPQYYPQVDKSVDPKVTVHLQRIYPAIKDMNTAIGLLKGQLADVVAGKTTIKTVTTNTTTTTSGVTSFNGETGAVVYFPELGIKNDQTGQVSYVLQQSDAGGFVIFDDSSPVAVDLNAAITIPFFAILINWGTGLVTLTPDLPAQINYFNNLGASSMPLYSGQVVEVQWDGVNWNAFYILGGPAGGDLSGQYPNPTVVGIQGRAVSSTAPTDRQLLQYNSGASQWQPTSPNEPVNNQTGTTYTFLDSDRAKTVNFSNASPVAAGLPQAGAGSQFVAAWWCDVVNNGVGTLTITPTTSTINGAATLVLTTGQGAHIVSDGTNYIAVLGKSGGSGTVTSVGLTMPNGFTVTGSPVTGAGTLAVAGVYQLGNYLNGQPNASQVVAAWAFLYAWTLPANCTGSIGKCGVNPTSTATYTLQKNGSTCGTVAISTSGVFTFATTGGLAVSFAANDTLTVVAPSSVDATLATVQFIFSATR